MRLLRLEDKQGLGPFRDMSNVRLMDRAVGVPSYHNQFPTPSEEGLPRERHHKCACLSARQFTKWFPSKMRKALCHNGYRLVTIEISPEHVHVGEEQVIYDTRHTA